MEVQAVTWCCLLKEEAIEAYYHLDKETRVKVLAILLWTCNIRDHSMCRLKDMNIPSMKDFIRREWSDLKQVCHQVCLLNLWILLKTMSTLTLVKIDNLCHNLIKIKNSIDSSKMSKACKLRKKDNENKLKSWSLEMRSCLQRRMLWTSSSILQTSMLRSWLINSKHPMTGSWGMSNCCMIIRMVYSD